MNAQNERGRLPVIWIDGIERATATRAVGPGAQHTWSIELRPDDGRFASRLRGDTKRHQQVPMVESFTVRKVGQWPQWFSSVPREVEKALDDGELALYRKGTTCIGQNYGIGALACFRRVIEDAVPALLDLIAEAAKLEQNDEVLAAVAQARESRPADEKLRLAAEALPALLRIGRVDPLARLFERYSAAMHSASDAECLETAMELKTSFDFAVVTMRAAQTFAKSFSQK